MREICVFLTITERPEIKYDYLEWGGVASWAPHCAASPWPPSVQCCLDREHLRGHPPGALIGVWLRGAAANIDSGGSGGAGTHTHTHTQRPTPAPSLWALPRGRPARQLTVKPRSTHGQLTVNSTVNSRSTQRSTQLSPGRLRTGFTLQIRQPVVIRTDKKLFTLN